MKYAVYYEIVTPESAEHSDYDELGEVIQTNDLREAIDALTSSRTCQCDSGDGPEYNGDWINYYHGQEFETGAYETRSLHFRSITVASEIRVAKLVGAA